MYQVSRKSLEQFLSYSLLDSFHPNSFEKKVVCCYEHVKEVYVTSLKKILRHFLLRESLPKVKIGQPISGFNEFSCSKRLIHFEKHVKKYLYIEFQEKITRTVFEIFPPGHISDLSYSIFVFSIFIKTWK